MGILQLFKTLHSLFSIPLLYLSFSRHLSIYLFYFSLYTPLSCLVNAVRNGFQVISHRVYSHSHFSSLFLITRFTLIFSHSLLAFYKNAYHIYTFCEEGNVYIHINVWQREVKESISRFERTRDWFYLHQWSCCEQNDWLSDDDLINWLTL